MDCVSQFKVDVPDCGQFATKVGAGKESSELEDAVRDFLLYPNPAKEHVTIRYDFSGSNATIEVYDISGRNISKNTLTSSNGEIQLDTSTYAAGMYMVVVRQNGVCVAQKKLVIE
ncbi:MAG: T9SS type A sorting domain-containing protein [Pedobacter sp.]|nr:MAG: T9SS type A sorting domain-containing protein [Pedobacter sp.]